VTSQFSDFILWNINGDLLTQSQLFGGALPGHNISGTNILILDITLGDDRNGSEYFCLLPSDPDDLMSDLAFLYVAGESANQVTFSISQISHCM